MGTAAAASEPGQQTAGSAIRVTSLVSNELRKMREADPARARAVDDAIRRIPAGGGEPVRINVPDAPPGRKYFAIAPNRGDAPVVIYRSLEPDDGAGEGWLVTTLISQSEYRDYRQAEWRGIVDSPVVREVAARAAGTVATIISAPLIRASGVVSQPSADSGSDEIFEPLTSDYHPPDQA
jgi:hypothetical protein